MSRQISLWPYKVYFTGTGVVTIKFNFYFRSSATWQSPRSHPPVAVGINELENETKPKYLQCLDLEPRNCNDPSVFFGH